MAIVKVEPNGDLWFLTKCDSSKVEEIVDNKHVALCAQKSDVYMSLSGTVSQVKDQELIKSLWKEEWKTWVPTGPDDPNLMLLKVTPTFGEYWDYGGIERKVQFMFEAVKSTLKGERPEIKGAHQKVDFKTGTAT